MTCLWCGEPLATINRRARYCSASCRSRAHRNGGPRVVPIGDRQPKGGGEIEVITTRMLRRLGVSDDVARAAPVTARALDSRQTPSSALATLTKSLQQTMRYLREREGHYEEQDHA
jgi:hypothetical protein